MHGLREKRGIVAGVAPLRREQRIFGKRHAHTGDALAVNAQKLCILCAVARGKLLRMGALLARQRSTSPSRPWRSSASR